MATFGLLPVTVFAQRLVLTPPAVTIMEGEFGEFTVVLSSVPTAEITVTIVPLHGTEISLDKTELTFTPSNWNAPQTVAILAGQDSDFAENHGAVILIARGEGYSGSGVSVRPDTVRMGSIGETAQLTAIIEDQDGESVTGVDLEWMSADPSIAMVDSVGTITGVGLGETEITAAFATASGTATVVIGNSDDSQVPDREILETLYQATGGENWWNQEGWMTNRPLGEWKGVSMDAEGYVTHLCLGANNLTGILPSSLGKLQRLEQLCLYDNHLTGPIPPELGNLSQLREALLLGNSFTGQIPPELGKLIRLKVLLLHGNRLTGSIPPEIGDLAQLQSFSVCSNELTGPIPPELGNLPQLRDLSLCWNSLSGSIPLELVSLHTLEKLRLDSNELTGSIPPNSAPSQG